MSPPAPGLLSEKHVADEKSGNGHEMHKTEHAPRGVDEHVIPPDLPRPGGRTMLLFLVVVVAVLAVLFVVGWIPHHAAARMAVEDAQEVADQIPLVNVAYPTPSVSSKSVTVWADIQGNQQTDIYPRATGYLKGFYADIHDRVKKGQLLALIEAPDVDAEVNQAQATVLQSQAAVDKAQADARLAKVTLDRYLDSQKISPGSVTQEDIDQNEATYDDDLSALAEARANVVAEKAALNQLQVQQSFERITAPYDGVITVRNYYAGALMSPSNTAAGAQMFSIVDDSVMRVFAKIPQADAPEVKIGEPVTLTVEDYPGRKFIGKVTRTSGSVDETNREFTTEMEFANPDGALIAGTSGTVDLPMAEAQHVLIIPTSALIFNADGLGVATVKDGLIHMVHNIQVGRDMGSAVEVTSGLSATDEIVTNPGTTLADGVKVTVHQAGKRNS